jgi:Holliday junction resolvase RusA-like endonuclease
MDKLYFTVPGEPIAKGRPRFGKGHTYTPKKTVDAEKHIAQCFNVKYPRHKVLAVSDFEVTVNFYSATPRKMDLDNLVKTFLDALNGLIWDDDKQVCRIHAVKFLVVPQDHDAQTEAWINIIGL